MDGCKRESAVVRVCTCEERVRAVFLYTHTESRESVHPMDLPVLPLVGRVCSLILGLCLGRGGKARER